MEYFRACGSVGGSDPPLRQMHDRRVAIIPGEDFRASDAVISTIFTGARLGTIGLRFPRLSTGRGVPTETCEGSRC
jgi:hypothetical protein